MIKRVPFSCNPIYYTHGQTCLNLYHCNLIYFIYVMNIRHTALYYRHITLAIPLSMSNTYSVWCQGGLSLDGIPDDLKKEMIVLVNKSVVILIISSNKPPKRSMGVTI